MSRSFRQSAGLLLYRTRERSLEFFLVHPGGPFWTKKDEGVWSIPKREYKPEEAPLAAARREFTEETGFSGDGDLLEIGSIRQKGGKVVAAWAIKGDCDPSQLKSNTFEMEWPPRTGRRMEVPEVDRGAWFIGPDARRYIRSEQIPFLERLELLISRTAPLR